MSAKKPASAKAKKPAASSRKSSAIGEGGKSSGSTAKIAKKPAAATKVAKLSVATDTRASGPATLSVEDIGAVAGDVWRLLVKNDGQTLAAMQESFVVPTELVAAAVGWLAREDKLRFENRGNALTISLKR
jgi:Winged helix-turn-helix domain (DUF2582)